MHAARVLCRSASTMAVERQRVRGSTRARRIRHQVLRMITTSSPCSVDVEAIERPRRRTVDVAAVQVVVAVVARAPDVLEVGAVLHRAGQVRAGGGERAELARRRADDDDGRRAEGDDLAGVRRRCPPALPAYDRRRRGLRARQAERGIG